MGGDRIRKGPTANGKSAGAVIFFANGLNPGPRDILRSDEAATEVVDAELKSVLITASGVDCEGGPVVFGVSGGCPLAKIAGDINGVADGFAIAGITGTTGTGAGTGAGIGAGSSTIGSWQMLC